MANKKSNMTAWVLKFAGSIAYLYVLWKLWAGVDAAGTFGPILFGLAAVMAVGFFIMTLVSLMSNEDEMKNWSMKSALIAGFALLAITAPTAATAGWHTWSLVSLLGFVLSYVGTGMDKNM